MITRTTGYASSDGTVHRTLEGAQRAEIVEIFKAHAGPSPKADPWTVEYMADIVMQNSTKLLDILTTTSRSKPRARAVNGGTKKRKPKATEPSMFKEPPTPSAA